MYGVRCLYGCMYEVFVHLGRLCCRVFFFRRCFIRPLAWWPCLCLVQVDFFRLSSFVGVRTWVVVEVVTLGVGWTSCSVRVGGCKAG